MLKRKALVVGGLSTALLVASGSAAYAAPAVQSDSAGHPVLTAVTSQTTAAIMKPNSTFIGVYDDPIACEIAGATGALLGEWSRWDCRLYGGLFWLWVD
jgi:hypothetical protein